MNQSTVYIRVIGGHIHRVVMQDGNVLSREQCQLDDAGEREYLDELAGLEALAADHSLACRHCFPAPVAISDDDVSAD